MIIKLTAEDHTAFHWVLPRFLSSIKQAKKKKSDKRKKAFMQKVYDFECDTCGKTFEQMITTDVQNVDCIMQACEGQAVRKLGGRPKRKSSLRSSASDEPIPNMGEMECHNEIIATKTLAEKTIDGQTVKLDLAIVEHTHKPKTQA